MIGKRIQYNKNMSGIIIDQNNTHVLIQFDSETKYCIPKIGIDLPKFNKELYEKTEN